MFDNKKTWLEGKSFGAKEDQLPFGVKFSLSGLQPRTPLLPCLRADALIRFQGLKVYDSTSFPKMAFFRC